MKLEAQDFPMEEMLDTIRELIAPQASAKTRPVPCCLAGLAPEACSKARNTRSCSSLAMPTPVSRTVKLTRASSFPSAGLVVEDNELNAEIAQCLLEERDFQVDCVHDGAQAVERVRSTPPGTYDPRASSFPSAGSSRTSRATRPPSGVNFTALPSRLMST